MYPKNPTKLILTALACAGALSVAEPKLFAQGCVAVRNCPMAPVVPGEFTNTIVAPRQWLGSLAYRWYESDRHFKGDKESVNSAGLTRLEQGTEVINDVHSFDVSATYGITERWSATIDFPFIYADRSSLYEHDGVTRHNMHSSGLGDIRLTTDYWLLNPFKNINGNIALGFGFKAPTGDDQAADIAYRSTGPILRPVDPSVQPGDGGWGIIFQLQAYQKIYKNLFGYVQGSYMITPQEQNNTEVTGGDRPGTPSVRKYDTIADQYFGRGGFSYVILPHQGLSLSLGSRIEGIPVWDAVGGSMGFRRPGYAISIEPGLSWAHKNNVFVLNIPVAVYRNRERSAPEIVLGRPGGDAAFADLSVLASFTHRF